MCVRVVLRRVGGWIGIAVGGGRFGVVGVKRIGVAGIRFGVFGRIGSVAGAIVRVFIVVVLGSAGAGLVGARFGARVDRRREIGRASCRERVCQYVSISVVAVSIKKKT